MGRLSQRDLRGITRFLALLQPGPAHDPIPRPVVAALRDLIGADEAEYFEFRRADRGTIAHAQSHDWHDAAGTDEALTAYGHENPLGWRRWRPADGPIRMSQRISRRALGRLGFHDAFLRPNRLTDALKVWLHSDEDSVACVQLWLHGPTFSQRQEDLLAVIQHHLAHVRSDAIGDFPAPASAVGLTRREAEVLTWAIRGASDDGIGALLDMATATVGKHLEHAFGKLGVHSRAEALWRITADRTDADDGGTLGT